MITVSNAADWHATMAMKAYRKKQWDAYRRHIRIADTLRSTVATATATWMELV